MGIEDGFIYGVFGGLLAEILGLFKLRHQAPNEYPAWFKSYTYWLITTAMILAGGGLVIVYIKSGIDLKAIIAVNIGASAPLIIASLAAQAPRATKSD